MIDLDVHLLSVLVNEYAAGKTLEPGERKEMIRIAQGFEAKESATSANWAVEAVRLTRKRLYRKLGVSGSHELVSALLALSLKVLACGQPLGEPMSSDSATLQVPANHAPTL